MTLDELEESHQLILLSQAQTLVLEYCTSRVRHIPETTITTVKYIAPVNTLESPHVLMYIGFHNQIHHLISAEQNLWVLLIRGKTFWSCRELQESY